MKKIIVITGILLIILSFANTVYAEAIPELPADWSSPYYIIGEDSEGRVFIHGFSDISGLYATEGTRPSLITTVDIMKQTNRYWPQYGEHEFSQDSYIDPYGPTSQYGDMAFKSSLYGTIWDNIIYINFTVRRQDGSIFMRPTGWTPIMNINLVDILTGAGLTPENPTIFDYFAGIQFDYDGFLGKLGIKLEAKKEGQDTYVPIQEWEYPEGGGTVNIDSHDIAYYNNASYKLTIYDNDEVINNYYYTVQTDVKNPYVDINYPVNGSSYDYYPNVNIRYRDMGELYIYINGSLYKRIQTKNKEGIEVIEGINGLFDIGLNTVYVEDVNSQTVATVQYMVMREGSDLSGELSEFEAESWVQELFNRVMNEYSMFFTYVKGIYSFLPVEIVGLVVIIMMLAVILWFTGRK